MGFSCSFIIDTKNRDFTNCLSQEIQHDTFSHNTFSICISTTVADEYDVSIFYKDELISNAPCYGCIYFTTSSLAVPNTLVEGLKSYVEAGEPLLFTVTLRDSFYNIISAEEGHRIFFTNNTDHSIVSTTGSNRDVNYFTLFFNHTQQHTFHILVDGIVYNTEPYVVNVISSGPSDLSSLSFVSDSNEFSVLSSIQVSVRSAHNS